MIINNNLTVDEVNYSIVCIVVLCMQSGNTPLQLAVTAGHHKTVEYFIKQAKMDITQFDMVCNIDTLLTMCIVL